MVGHRNNIIMDLNRLCSRIMLVTSLLVTTSLCSPDDQCRFIFREDYVLDVVQSEDNGATVRHIVHATDKIKCAEQCCEEDGTWCTLGVFHKGTRDMNCFLVQCTPESSNKTVCVSRHLYKSGFTSIQISHHPKQLEHQGEQDTSIMTTKAITSTMRPATVKVTAPTTSRRPTTTARGTSPTDNSETTPMQAWNTEETNQRTNNSRNNVSEPMGTEHSGNYTEETSGDDGNDTNVEHEEKTDFDNRQSVTSTGILIATFCFGLIFFLAIIVVLGKRWHEGYKRRHYSKVNYLINGMYS